jgi:DUF2933 family protein
MSSQHHAENAHHSSLQDWLWSRAGIVTLVAVAILGFLVYTGHTVHLLGFVPYLLLLACPLMHLFMHGGHGGHHHHEDKEDKGNR